MDDAERTEDRGIYRVVVNHEGRYSIWAEDRELPGGWRNEGLTGSRERCLAHLERELDALSLRPRIGPPLASESTVHRLVEVQSGQRRGSIAVVAGDDRLTYADLDRKANQLANHLLRHGVGTGTRVAICAERGLELVVGVLGILKAGAAYVPLDPEYPTARLVFMLADAAVPVVVTQGALSDRFAAATVGTVVCVDHDGVRARIEEESELAPPSSVSPADVAYVIYTSGSTGVPKGVAMPHASLVNLLRWQAGDSTAGTGTTTLQFASIGFDVAFQELFSTWSTGGTVIMVTEDERRDLRALWRRIVAQNVQRVFLPPAVLSQLARVAAAMALPAPALREVITAGEALRLDKEVRSFFSGHPRCRLVNHYGPTEAHVVTAYHLEGDPDEWSASPPIGVPIANAQAYVLSDNLQPVAGGLPGELCLGGACVGDGYFGRRRQTAERFVPDPFGERPGGRLYRTGDLVRQLADGNLEFLGRVDRQVKVRGFRIELAEIEMVLAQHPCVADAVVTLRHDLPGGPSLVAYVVPSSAPLSGHEAAMWMTERLPSHMVPTAVVMVPSVPRTRNGKVDYEALPPARVPEQEDKSEPPDGRTPVEAALAECFSELLGQPNIGTHENFFSIGGHSLLATQLTSRVRDRFHIELPLRRVFDNPTVAALAVVITQEQRTQAPPAGGPGGAEEPGWWRRRRIASRNHGRPWRR